MPQVARILVIGQSNGGFFCMAGYDSKYPEKVLHDWLGDVRPLLASLPRDVNYLDNGGGGSFTSGPQGSYWGMVGDLMVESGIWGSVTFTIASVGSTAARHWDHTDTASSELVRDFNAIARLEAVLGYAETSAQPFTHVLFIQGETDGIEGTAQAAYTQAVKNLVNYIRFLGCSSPIFIGLSTLCFSGVSYPIRSAQVMAVSGLAAVGGVRLGVDSDMVAPDGLFVWPDSEGNPAFNFFRQFDGCHIFDWGMTSLSRAWFSVLVQQDGGV